jgi:mRNA interferase MazF
VVQGDSLNRSKIATVVCVPLTSNVKWSNAPGKESVANVSQIVSLDKSLLTERAGRLTRTQLGLVISGIDILLGR